MRELNNWIYDDRVEYDWSGFSLWNRLKVCWAILNGKRLVIHGKINNFRLIPHPKKEEVG